MGPENHPACRFWIDWRKTDLRLLCDDEHVEEDILRPLADFVIGQVFYVPAASILTPPHLVSFHDPPADA